MNKHNEIKSVLITGVTGYVGGRLVPRLLLAGYRVRVLVRGKASRLDGRPWKDQVEIAIGDVLAPETLAPAMDGIDAAYYLIHSMSGHDEFSSRDVEAAANFARSASQAGVRNII
ncbi:MAG: NAD(P)H-binding protein, partial [Candidatus Promineifilaceae bacterium]|nr:NAD(P)H-binding protein [Candidatus Promineifilaceae bacterium]